MIDARRFLTQMEHYADRAGSASGPMADVPSLLVPNTVVVGLLEVQDKRRRSAAGTSAPRRPGFVLLPPATFRGAASFRDGLRRLPQAAYLAVDLLEDVAYALHAPDAIYAYLTQVWGVDPGAATETRAAGQSHLYARGTPPPMTRAGLARWVEQLSVLGGVPATWVAADCAPRLMATLASNARREGESVLRGLGDDLEGLGDWDLAESSEPIVRHRRADVARSRGPWGATTRRPDVNWSTLDRQATTEATGARAGRYFDPLYPRCVDETALRAFSASLAPFAQAPKSTPFRCNPFSGLTAGRLFVSLWERLFPANPHPYLQESKAATVYSLDWQVLRDIYRNLYLALEEEDDLLMQSALREAMIRLVLQRESLKRWWFPPALIEMDEDVYRVEREPKLWGIRR